MNSSDCPCSPSELTTALLQEKRDAFLRQFEDGEWPLGAVLRDVATRYPDDTTRAELIYLELQIEWKPPFPAGCLDRVLDFDGMVQEASYRLFGRSVRDGLTLDNVNRPDFACGPPFHVVLERSFARFRYECYRNGFCLHCSSLIKHASREGEPGKEGKRTLRALLALFDREGEPLPPGLRQWSAESRLRDAPPGPRGSPNQNWLRDLFIIHTVATLSYLTGRNETRDLEKQDGRSCCDAVARAFQDNGLLCFTFRTAQTAWSGTKSDGVAPGPAMLKAWIQQDRNKKQALSGRQRRLLRWWRELDPAERRAQVLRVRGTLIRMRKRERAARHARAQRRWARLSYWREQG